MQSIIKYRCHDDKNNLLPEGMTTAQTQSSNERRYNYVMMIKNNLLRMTTASTQSSRESKYDDKRITYQKVRGETKITS